MLHAHIHLNVLGYRCVWQYLYSDGERGGVLTGISEGSSNQEARAPQGAFFIGASQSRCGV
ncbi:MAG: hypothetical protein ABL911_12645 [Gallionella sp.]